MSLLLDTSKTVEVNNTPIVELITNLENINTDTTIEWQYNFTKLDFCN